MISDLTPDSFNEFKYDDFMNIVKSLEKADLSKVVGKTIKNKADKQKGGFLNMLLGVLVASLLKNLLTGNRVKTKIPGRGVIKESVGAIEQTKILMPPNHLINFEIQKYS